MPIDGLIVVLGSPNSDKGNLYSIATERCRQALKEWQKHKHYKLLLTGGYGSHFNTTEKPHASYLKSHLISLGIPGAAFIEFAESKNTLEDASLSKPIVLKYNPKEMIVVTSDYHHQRAAYIFNHTFKSTGISIRYAITQTNRKKCQIDLDPLIMHEKKALKQLKIQHYF